MPKNDFFALRKRLRIPSQKRNFPKSAQLGRFLHYQAKKNPTEIVSTSVGLRGGATQIRTGGGDFADLCLTAWLWRHTILFEKKSIHETAVSVECRLMNGAGNGARTRHLSLGKAALYQMSYSRRKTGASEWT